jgi:hypothetical protein
LGGFEIIDEFLVFVSIVDGEFEFAFFGPQDDGLAFHAADHVEGSSGFSPQRQLEQVFFDARFDGLAQLGSHFEESVSRAEAFDALMRPLVIVVLDPETDPLPRGIEAFKLGAAEELLPEGFPEAFDLAQRHGVMGPGLEVMRPVLVHLGLEAGGASPVDVFPAVVGEHLPGRLVFGRGDPEHLQHVFGGVAAEQVGADDEARVIVHEGDEIGIASSQPEGEDIGLPELVGRRSLEEPRPDQVAPRLGRGLD